MKKLYIIPLLIFLAGCSLVSETYYVKEIRNHYPQQGDNSQTSITVWQSGKSGHVKEILCAFPPDLQLTGSNETGWSGVSKVQVGQKYEEFMFGEVSYLCTALE